MVHHHQAKVLIPLHFFPRQSRIADFKMSNKCFFSFLSFPHQSGIAHSYSSTVAKIFILKIIFSVQVARLDFMICDLFLCSLFSFVCSVLSKRFCFNKLELNYYLIWWVSYSPLLTGIQVGVKQCVITTLKRVCKFNSETK